MGKRRQIKLKISFVFNFLFLLSISSSSTVFGQYYFSREYGLVEGISQSTVRAIVQDSIGTIWIGTDYGLNRFNGSDFRTYYIEDGLTSNEITSLYIDHSGDLWVATTSGLHIITIGEWLSDIEISEVSLDMEDIIFPISDIKEENQDKMWFATDGFGVWVWDRKNDKFIHYDENNGLSSNRVRSIALWDRAVWVATRKGLNRLSNNHWQHFDMTDGLLENKLRVLEVGTDNRLWIGSRKGVSVFDGKIFTNYSSEDINEQVKVLSIAFSRSGDIWIGSERGVFRIQDGRLVRYNLKGSINDEYIFDIHVDENGFIWFGSLRQGLHFLPKDFITLYTSESGLPYPDILDILEDNQKNQIWFASNGGGLIKLKDEKFSVYDTEDGLLDNRIYSIAQDSSGNLYVGTRDGINIIDHNGIIDTFLFNHPFYRKPSKILVDHNRDGVWIGNQDGYLIYYDNKRKKDTVYTTTLKELRDLILLENGDLIVAHIDELWILSHGQHKLFPYKNHARLREINSIYFDNDQTLWVSTSNGLYLLSFSSDSSAMERVSQLPHQYIYFVRQLETDNSHYIIGTKSGLVKYIHQNKDKKTPLSIKLLDNHFEIVSQNYNNFAVLNDKKGGVWIGSNLGVGYIQHNSWIDTMSLSLIFDQIITTYDTVTKPLSSFVLDFNRSFTEFRFSPIHFFSHSNFYYEYRLLGRDQEWNRVYDTHIDFNHLNSGHYTLNVRAKDYSGRVYAMLSQAFIVNSPLWMQWWFLLLFVLFIVWIIWVIYKYSIFKRKYELERIRINIASDLHDDIGSSLTEIALYSDILSDSVKEEKQKNMTQELGILSRRIVSSLDDIVWAIDARNNTIGDLTDRIQDFAQRVLELQNIHVYYMFDIYNSNYSLPIEQRQNLYLIIREAINNIAKHSTGKQVKIEMKVDSMRRYCIVIFDNGILKTLNNNQRGGSNGLQNMNMRAKRIQAECHFVQNNEGFRVTIKGTFSKKWKIQKSK